MNISSRNLPLRRRTLVKGGLAGILASGLARHLVQALWQRRINRLSGAIFAGFGCVLLRYRP